MSYYKIPISSQNGFTFSASSVNQDISYAFDGDINTFYRSSIIPSLPENLTVIFPNRYKIVGYKISIGYVGSISNMKTWDFQGLVNGQWTTLHSGANDNAVAVTLEFEFEEVEVQGIRIVCKSKHGNNSWGINELEVYGKLLINIGESLIYPELGWKRYDDSCGVVKYISQGSWGNDSSNAPNYYMRTMHYTNNPLSTKFEFDFVGTKLRLIGRPYPDQSTTIVTIDGVSETFRPQDLPAGFQILEYEKQGLENKKHKVEITFVGDNQYTMVLDAIDIDDTGRLLHPDEVTDIADLDIGKRIRAHCEGYSNKVAAISGLGEETSGFIPTSSPSAPNGDFYLICVDRDYLGRWKLIADRNIQTISYDLLNVAGYASGSGVVRSSMSLSSMASTATSSGDGFTFTTSGAGGARFGSRGISSGKWYWEVKMLADNYFAVGVGTKNTPVNNPVGSTTVRAYAYSGVKYNGTSSIAYGASYTVGDIIGIALDMDNGIIEFYKNGISQGIAFSDLKSLGSVYPLVFSWSSSGNPSFKINFGDMVPFSHSVPQGYSALPSIKYTVRLMTGGINANDKDNEWDKYIVSSDLEGTITPGDNNVWNWNGVYTRCSTTPTGSPGNRVARGNTAVTTFSSGATNANYGFRPVVLVDYVTIISFDGSLDREIIHNENVILSGTITEDENLDVQYRIEVNGVQIYPETGYTSPQTSPLEISHEIANSYFRVGLNLVRLYVTNGSEETNFDFFVTLTNEVPMIEISMTGMKIDATITDDDNDDVQYNVYLNGNKIYPTDGDEYTEFITPPITFSRLFKENEIYIGQNNVLTINVRDIYGGENTVTINFIGDYTGLMFLDGSGNYYSTNLGDIIKYLDFGDVYAGQTSHIMKVIIKNTNPNAFNNIRLKKVYDENVLDIEISKTNNPFIPESELIYDQVLAYGDTLEFYIRLTPNIETVGEKFFELNVEADPVSIQ